MGLPGIRQRFESTWTACLDESEGHPAEAVARLMQLLEDFLDVEQIESAITERASAYLFDMSNLGFSGLAWNIVVVSAAPKDKDDEEWQARFLVDQKAAADSTGICFHILLTDERPTKHEFVPSSLEAVFLSGDDLRTILRAELPKMALAAAIREQTPVSRLCPFNTDREAVGSMFYGRRQEVNMCVEELSMSLALEGARRIGKTSLLKQAYRILRGRSRRDSVIQAYYFNCLTWTSYRTACHAMARRIDPRREMRLDLGESNVQYLFERSSRYGRRPLYLFLDEVDRLIELDAAKNWPFFSLLAWAKDEGFVRLVLAGYRSIGQLVRDETRTNGSDLAATSTAPSPLYGKLTPMRLGPLSRAETHALTSAPLISSDLRIDVQTAVEEAVWDATAGYPFLVQFFGDHLFRRGSVRTPQQVDVEDVAEVAQCSELSNFLVTHFIENTVVNTRPSVVERAATLLFAHSQDRTWKEQDFLRACRDAEVPFGSDLFREIHAALDNLCASQILTHDHGQYRFAFPVMRDVLVETYSDPHNIIPDLCASAS